MNTLDWLDMHQAPTEPKPSFFAHAFSYSQVFRGLAAATPTTIEMPTESDSDFVLRYTTNQTERGAAVVADPEITMEIIDTGSGRILIQTRDLALCGGTAQVPYIWPEPPILRGGTTFAITLTALAGAADARVDITFTGFKVFFRSPAVRVEFRQGKAA